MHIVKTGLSLLTAALLAISTSLAQNCNPAIPLTKPDSRYLYNPAGDEVTDTVTELIWKRCAEGMSWSGGTCVGTATTFTWDGALAHAATQSGWRLPNMKELISLMETACYAPAINQTAFPATPGSAWSGSPFAAYPGNAWGVLFYDGGVYGGGDKDDYYYSVRLVRGQ